MTVDRFAGLYGTPTGTPMTVEVPVDVAPSTAVFDPRIPAATHPLDFAPIRAWLTCPEQARLNVVAAPAERDLDPDAVIERMSSGGANIAARTAQLLELADVNGWTVVVIDRELAGWVPAVHETRTAMESGVDLIVSGCLSTKTLDGSPHLLVRSGTTGAGAHAYTAVLIKDHKPMQGEAAPKPQPVTFLSADLNDGLWAAHLVAQLTGKPQQLDAVQGAHYWRLLDAAGHAGPCLVGIWGKPVVTDWTVGEGQTATGRAKTTYTASNAGRDLIVWADLNVNDAYTNPETGARLSMSALDIHIWCEANLRRTLRVERRRLLDPAVLPATIPEHQSACGDCPHRTRCRTVLEAADDITLLAGVTPPRARIHRAAGVNTRKELAALNYTRAVADATKSKDDHSGAALVVDRYRGTAAAGSLPDAIDTARVALNGAVFRARGTTHVQIAAARYELDVDIEDDGGYVFQIGVLATTRYLRQNRPTERSRYTSHITRERTPVAEAETFAAFWRQVTATRRLATKANAEVAIYVYSAHEQRTFIALAQRHAGHPGVPTADDVAALTDSPLWVDLYPVCRDELVYPTMTRSLKDTAKIAGHAWRDESPSGANAMAWWRTAVDPDCDPDTADQLIARLEDYNEDDVWATKLLRDWLRTHGGVATPAASLANVAELGPNGQLTAA